MDEAKSRKSGKSGKSGNSGKAVWDPFAAEVFLDVCIEQVLARNRHEGYLNQTGYQNLIKNFNERTKRNYVRKQFKNRWETLKKEYSTWKTLNQSASGLGRDPITKTIDASDEWWELEIKRCPDAAKFRHAPLANEDKMCRIFDKHCVTNEHARVPLPTSLAGPSQRVPSSVNIDDDDLSGTEIDDLSTIVIQQGETPSNDALVFSK